MVTDLFSEIPNPTPTDALNYLAILANQDPCSGACRQCARDLRNAKRVYNHVRRGGCDWVGCERCRRFRLLEKGNGAAAIVNTNWRAMEDPFERAWRDAVPKPPHQGRGVQPAG